MPRPPGYHLSKSPRYIRRLETIKDFIKSYWVEHHFSPSNNEIAKQFGVSNSVASNWLDSLEEDSWIEPRMPMLARNIVPMELFKDRPIFTDNAVPQ